VAGTCDPPAESLENLLRPRSIALVGVPREGGRVRRVGGAAVLANLERFGFAGQVNIVHPEADQIGGRPAYRSLADIPQVPDAVVVSLPARRVPDVAQECGKLGITAMVVQSAGFSELGTAAGTELEAALQAVADRYGIAICGPNSLGLVNVLDNVFMANFAPLEVQRPVAGGLALISHSGALAGSLMARAVDRQVGLAYVISAGNETTVTIADYIRQLAADDRVQVLSLYLEGASSGRDLRAALEVARAAGKPVVAYKVGDSDVGARAALSHTAKIAGEPALYRGLFAQTGVITARSLDELIQIPMYFLATSGQRVAPRRVAVVTISGGLGAVTADELARHDIEVPELSSRTRRALDALALPLGSSANPVDTAGATQGGANALSRIVHVVAADPDIDAVVLTLASRFGPSAAESARELPAIAEEIAKQAIANEEIAKPVVAVWYSGSDNADAVAALRATGRMACFEDVGSCATALSAARRFVERNSDGERADAPPISAPGSQPGLPRGLVDEPTAKEILCRYDIRMLREQVTSTPEETVAAAEEIGYPVALKVVAAQIPHKVAAGGVRLRLTSAAQVREAHADILAAVARSSPGVAVRGMLVQEMVRPEAEILVGAYRDASFGPVLAVGRGGSRAEQFGDVNLRVLPVNRADCGDLVREAGWFADGRDEELIAAVADAVAAVARAAWELAPALAELDVNPLVVSADGRVAVLDAMMRFEE
jgi:acetate---CoA ligase (ADP-forming)